MLRSVLAVALALAAFGALVESALARPDSRRADRALDRSLERVVGLESGPPGAIAIVQRGSQRRVHTAGVGNVKTRRRPRANDRMRIASVAKAFSGASALSLVGQGRLRVNDTIGKLLPDLPPAWHTLTLGQLLQHKSGLPDFSGTKAFGDALVADLHGTPAPRTLLSFVFKDPLLFTPGSRYKYSNTDNVVVALMVAAVTGQAYEQALQTQVAGPLGLTRTLLPLGFELSAPAIRGYDTSEPKPEDVTTVVSAAWSYASGGVVSTPADLNRFVRGYVGRQLFGSDIQQQQLTLVAGGSEPPGPGRNSAGLGIFRYQTSCGTVYGHTGNTLGYTQFIASSIDGRRSATVAVNGQFTPNAGGRKAVTFRVLRRAYLRAVCAASA